MITIEQIESPKIMGIINLTPDSFMKKADVQPMSNFAAGMNKCLPKG